MTVRKIFLQIHRWLGLISGLLIFIIAITGCLYAFQAEIRSLDSFRFVEPAKHSYLPPSKLRKVAESTLPDKKLHAILYHRRDESAEAIFYNYSPDYYYHIVFLDPYSGTVLRVKNMENDFFQWVLDGHYYLWLPPEIGQPLVASVTLVFTILLISGLILWWPKNKKATPQRFRIKWKAKWRRRNFDFHTVAGFYASWIAILLALTGLIWGFQWFASFTYTMAGGDKEIQYADPGSVSGMESHETHSLDKVWKQMQKEYPQAAAIEIHIPDNDNASIAANANPESGTYWKLDYRYFDQRTLREQEVSHIYGRFEEAKGADKLLRLNYDIHTGAILGLPGKILAFFASLLVATLPVTGIWLWFGRKYKKKSPREWRRRALNTVQ